MKLENLKIAIIGLGYVGLPLAVEFGKKIPVIGFDIHQKRIQELQNGQDHTLEVSPEELKQATHLSYSANLDDLSNCNFFIVTVPTPIDEFKQPDLTPLIKASTSIGKILKKGDVVVYESTVYPGATEESCIPVLEQVSGLKFNQDFFASEGEQLFSNIQVNAALLTEQLYKDTCLRDMQNQEVYSFDVEDDELSIYQHFPDSVELNIQTGKYEQAVKSVTFNIEPAPDNAWLSLSPAQLKELTLEYGLAVQEGCKLSLSVYNDQSPQWIYHLGFGVYH